MKCGRKIENESEELCSSCKRETSAFDSGRCTFIYNSEIGEAIKQVKRNGTREFLDFFGVYCVGRHELFLKSIGPKALVPVPLTDSRLRQRGFNQSELLAQSFSRIMGIPVKKLLVKTRNTKDQKGLNRWQRTNNLIGAFKAEGNEPMPDKVLLVDDIYTTGSTVNACAAVLKAAGVKEVYFICIAAGTADD